MWYTLQVDIYSLFLNMNMEKLALTNEVIANRIFQERVRSIEEQELRKTVVDALVVKGAESEEALREAYEAALLAEKTIETVSENRENVTTELLAKMQETVMNPLAEKLGVSPESLSLEKIIG